MRDRSKRVQLLWLSVLIMCGCSREAPVLTEIESMPVTEATADLPAITTLFEEAGTAEKIEFEKNIILCGVEYDFYADKAVIRGGFPGGGTLSTEEFEQLIQMPNLKTLSVDIDSVCDCDYIAKIATLKQLSIPYTFISAEMLEKLSELPELEILSINISRAESLEVLSKFPTLKELHIYSNLTEKTAEDFTEDLAALTELRKLVIYDAGLKNIDFVSEMKKLEILDIQENHVTDISPIKNLTHLKELNIAYNDISDFSVLYEMKNLGYLFVKGENITDEQLEELRKNLPECEISNY